MTPIFEISLSDDDIISYIHTICDSFISLSEQKDVSLTFYSAVSSLNMLFDGDSVFAKGAVEAGKFLAGQPAGMYDMGDVIQF